MDKRGTGKAEDELREFFADAWAQHNMRWGSHESAEMSDIGPFNFGMYPHLEKAGECIATIRRDPDGVKIVFNRAFVQECFDLSKSGENAMANYLRGLFLFA